MIRVDAETPYLVHNELESGKDTANVPDRLLRYNAEADFKFGLPVLSHVFLLRRESDSPALTGRLKRLRPNRTTYLTFEYEVVRVWKLDVEAILSEEWERFHSRLWRKYGNRLYRASLSGWSHESRRRPARPKRVISGRLPIF
jgi:hypothetical protein